MSSYCISVLGLLTSDFRLWSLGECESDYVIILHSFSCIFSRCACIFLCFIVFEFAGALGRRRPGDPLGATWASSGHLGSGTGHGKITVVCYAHVFRTAHICLVLVRILKRGESRIWSCGRSGLGFVDISSVL